MIESIRDILIKLETEESPTKKLLKAFEVCELVFEKTALDDIDYKALESEDAVIDNVLPMDEIVKYLNGFLSTALNHLESDLKGSDFETEIRENLEQLEKLQKEHHRVNKLSNELGQKKEEAVKLQEEMMTLQLQIDEYEQIDLEKIEVEKEAMLQHLANLEKEEAENLVIYKRHLEENESLNIEREKLLAISKEINEQLLKMDSLIGSEIV